jgi:aminoglycoside phosphotransferase family enzyme/predicted kinase
MDCEVDERDQQTDMTRWLEMVERLRRSADWSPDEGEIEMIQTHISVVLLGRRHVIKLKKPVDFGFLDYTTLDKRLCACEAEVTLNRRLCADTYLGVQTVMEIDGQPRLSGAGRIIDYGVRMKRLPAERMLDRMVKDNTVTESVVDRVADKLARFHRAAKRDASVDVYGSPEVIRQNWEENFTQTAPFVNRTITPEAFASVRRWVFEWLARNDDLLKARVRGGKVCDGHGDLRAESICVTNGICFFDCIEFNERFRCGDVASEVAFLAMDLDARGRPDLGYYFCERYETISADRQLLKLLPFYRCYRAFVRGKVLSFRLEEPGFSEAELQSAQTRARSYFDLAARYAARLREPTMIVVAGLSGTGKTSVARAVAGELGLRVVSADAARKMIFGDTRGFEYGKGAYSEDANRLTYRKMLEEGCEALKEGGGVVLDATFRRTADRMAAREMAESSGARWRLIECRLSPDLIRARLDQRAAKQEGISDATWETHLLQRDEYEPEGDASVANYLALDTSGNLVDVSRGATDWLRAVSTET